MSQSTAKGTVQSSAAQMFNFLAGYAVYIFIGRYLGPESLGAYGVATAVIAVIAVLNSGLSFELLKLVSREERAAKSAVREVMKIQALASAVIIAAFFLAGRLLEAYFGSGSTVFYLQLLVISVPLQFFFSASVNALTGLKKFAEAAWALTYYGIFRIVLTLGLIVAGFGLLGAFTGYVLSFLLAAIVAWVLLAGKMPSVNEKINIAKLVRASLVMLPFSVGIYLIQNVDLFALKALLRDNALVGMYVAASTISRIQFFAISTFSSTFVPVLTRSLHADDLKKSVFYVKSFLRYAFMGLIPLTLVLAATAPFAVSMLYSAKFSEASAPLLILLFASACLTIFNLLSMVVAVYDSAFASKLMIFLVCLDVALNLFLIPSHGVMGAAYASLACFALGMAIVWLKARSKFSSLVDAQSASRIIFASVLVAILALLITPVLPNKFLLPVEYAFLGIVYLLVLKFLGEITHEDIKIARSVLPIRK
ncbi:MAG: oligosaccharide flippase family protein [Candidatus Micrarchaeota archaeon]